MDEEEEIKSQTGVAMGISRLKFKHEIDPLRHSFPRGRLRNEPIARSGRSPCRMACQSATGDNIGFVLEMGGRWGELA